METIEIRVNGTIAVLASGSEILGTPEKWTHDPDGQAAAARLRDAWERIEWRRVGRYGETGILRADREALDELFYLVDSQADSLRYESDPEVRAEARAYRRWCDSVADALGYERSDR